MNKYIRTKYKIILPKNELSLKRILASSSKYIIKSADTIKKLCDKFIIIRNGEGADFWKDFDAMKHYSAYINLNDYDAVYGAIWTDKGLLYVAKMNEEGELELI